MLAPSSGDELASPRTRRKILISTQVDAERRAYRDVDHRWDHQTLSRKHHKDMTNAAGTFDHRTRSIPVTDFAVATPAADDAWLKCVDSENRPPPDSHYVVPAKGLRPPPSRIARRPLEPVDQPPPPPAATAKEEDASLVSSLPEEYRYASDEISSSSSSEDSDEYDDDGYRRGRWTHRPADF